MSSSHTGNDQNFYTVLNLPSPTTQASTPVTAATIKQAYHTALLKYHPDKLNSPSKDPIPSVSSIQLAYATLSDPALRSAHDRALLLRKPVPSLASNYDNNKTDAENSGAAGNDSASASSKASAAFHTGSEQLDLDDMHYNESDDGSGASWNYACRCGDARGFVLTEAQLEAEEARGGREVVVGCTGCSLWVRVAFGVVELESNRPVPVSSSVE
jgi:diphthamide biosynthesis protein 4